MTRDRLEDYSRLIWAIAHDYGNQADVGDLFALGCQTFERCCDYFDESCGRFETYLGRALNNDMIRSIRKRKPTVVTDFDHLFQSRGDHHPSPVRSVSFRDALDQLSADAQEVVDLVLDPPRLRIAQLPPKKLRGWIRRCLRARGWSQPRVYRAYHEIQDLLRSF